MIWEGRRQQRPLTAGGLPPDRQVFCLLYLLLSIPLIVIQHKTGGRGRGGVVGGGCVLNLVIHFVIEDILEGEGGHPGDLTDISNVFIPLEVQLFLCRCSRDINFTTY